MAIQPKDYALVIGIDDYPKYGAVGRPLRGAVRDAERFAKWLLNKSVGGGLPDANCRVILSHSDPLAPTHGDIDKALEEIWDQARADGARRLYFYFSGHGQAEQAHDVALCLANWSRNRRHAALSSSKYLDFIVRCTPFKEVIVFLDCCRLRKIGAHGLKSELGCAVPVDDAGAKRSFLAYATEFEKAAFEADGPRGGESVDPTAEPEPEEEVRGHFTEALLSAFWGAAASPEGGVTATALKAYLESEVPRIAMDSGHKQYPQIPFDLPLADQPVFGAARPQANYEIRFSPGRRGVIQLEGPNLEILREADAATGPWQLTLETGWHCLREVDSSEEKTFRFQPTEGTRHVVF